MKKTIIVLAACFITATTFAQDAVSKEDIDVIQSVFGKEKKELVQQYMTLAPDQSAKFWSIYDEYEVKRKELNRQRIGIIQDYATAYDKLDNAKADDLAKRALENEISLDKLHLQYYKKVSTAVGGVNAAKFFQLEGYLQTIIKAHVMDQIPFIGELDKTKKPTNQM